MQTRLLTPEPAPILTVPLGVRLLISSTELIAVDQAGRANHTGERASRLGTATAGPGMGDNRRVTGAEVRT